MNTLHRLATASTLLFSLSAFAQLPPVELPVGKGTIGISCRTEQGKLLSFRPIDTNQVSPEEILSRIQKEAQQQPGNCGLDRVTDEELSQLNSTAPSS